VLGGRDGSVEDFGRIELQIAGHRTRGSFRRAAVCASRSSARATAAPAMVEAGGIAFPEQAL
jgi:hypothetical protein